MARIWLFNWRHSHYYCQRHYNRVCNHHFSPKAPVFVMLSCLFGGAPKQLPPNPYLPMHRGAPKKPPAPPNQATSAAASARFASKLAAAPRHRKKVNQAKPGPVANLAPPASEWTESIGSALVFSKAWYHREEKPPESSV